jgi:hypothetical protein
MRKALHCSSVAKWQSGWPNPPEEEIAHQAYTGSARTGAATEIAAVVATAVTRRQANDVFMPDDRCWMEPHQITPESHARGTNKRASSGAQLLSRPFVFGSRLNGTSSHRVRNVNSEIITATS